MSDTLKPFPRPSSWHQRPLPRSSNPWPRAQDQLGTASRRQRQHDRWRQRSLTTIFQKSSCPRQSRMRTHSSALPASPRRRTICNPAYLLAQFACAIRPTNGTRIPNAESLCTRAIARRTVPRLAPGSRPPSSASASNFAQRGIVRSFARASATCAPFFHSSGLEERKLKVFSMPLSASSLLPHGRPQQQSRISAR